MKYNFKCECGKSKTINCKMSDVKNTEIVCECGKKMYMEFSKNLIVPQYMRASNITEMSTINSSMKNLPSGKRKVIY